MPLITVHNDATNAAKTLVNGEEFYRYTGSDKIGHNDGKTAITPGGFSKFAIKTNRILSDSEVEQVAGIVGFYWKTIVKGKEKLSLDFHGLHERGTILVFSNALYTNGRCLSNSHDPEYRFAEFVSSLNVFLDQGTKVRADGSQLVKGTSNPVAANVYLNAVNEEMELPVRAEKKDTVEIPWETSDTDYFADKSADELTFSDVRLLLATLRAEQKKTQALNVKVSDLEGKLATIEAVFN